MKTTFRAFLREFRSGQSSTDARPFDQVENDFENSIKTDISVDTNIGAVDFYRHTDEMGFKYYLFAVNQNIVGYMFLQQCHEYWQVMDVVIQPQYRRQGIGEAIYLALIRKMNMKLMNGYSLSGSIEKLWRKLPSLVSVRTYDKQTNKVLPYDERPKEDIPPSGLDQDQRYFWVAFK